MMMAEYSDEIAERQTAIKDEAEQKHAGQTKMQLETTKKRGRGRPKGATSSTLSDVRAQAAEEKRKAGAHQNACRQRHRQSGALPRQIASRRGRASAAVGYGGAANLT